MPSYKSLQIPREKAGNLRPLKSKQIAWLTEQGRKVGEAAQHQHRAWWISYFNLPAAAWTDPYAMTDARAMPGTAWAKFRHKVTEDLEQCRADKEYWASLIASGDLPPENRQNYMHITHSSKHGGSQHARISRYAHQHGDPYALPEYFDWWQAEYAFRRGYRDTFEGDGDNSIEESLRATLKDQIQRGGGQAITANKMQGVAQVYRNDPALQHFFTEYANELHNGTAKQFAKLSDLIVVAVRYRDSAYEVFSPEVLPARGGGSFFGLGRTRRKRKRTR
jgi:hypothetical protein